MDEEAITLTPLEVRAVHGMAVNWINEMGSIFNDRALLAEENAFRKKLGIAEMPDPEYRGGAYPELKTGQMTNDEATPTPDPEGREPNTHLFRGSPALRSWSRYQQTDTGCALCGSRENPARPFHATEDPAKVTCPHCVEVMLAPREGL